MERRQLEFFLAIAEAGSFTGAARRLSVAQPSLSYAMRVLEAELGSSLFERHGRGVRLTPAGEAFVSPARRTLRSFALAEGAVRGVADEGFARLRIVSSTLWAVEPLVGVIAELRQLRPRVHFEVTDPASRTVVVEQVRAGEVDFGLLDGVPPGGAVAHLELARHELVAVMPPATPATGARPHAVPPVGLEEVAGHGLVCTPPGTALRTLLDEQLELASLPREVQVETAHVASVVPLVLAGAGAAVLPEGMAADAAIKGARVARLAAASSATVSLLWLPERLGDAGRALVGVARHLVGDDSDL